ncbi:MAG: hypothetical protein Ct9H300mP16_14970 [Pseudomonadota bacterium]|nr:MAG: hypothetical protein Ct9H300mP16_14970 [Pseudomonadota bacterium]
MAPVRTGRAWGHPVRQLGRGHLDAGRVILLLVIYPILDVVTGTARRSHPPRTRAGPLDAIPYLHVVFHLAVMVALLWRALEDGNAWTTWAAALGSGLNTGTSAIVVAHELGHSRPLTLRWWLAKFNLLTALYLHFTLEHNRHHHPAVATTADPASAPRDRAFWAHLVRTVPGQLASAWQISGKSGRRGLMNAVLHGLLLQTALLACCGLLCPFGAHWRSLPRLQWPSFYWNMSTISSTTDLAGTQSSPSPNSTHGRATPRGRAGHSRAAPSPGLITSNPHSGSGN